MRGTRLFSAATWITLARYKLTWPELSPPEVCVLLWCCLMLVPCRLTEPATAGVHRRSAGRGGALRATDTLSVAWLRGGFGRDAGASSAGFRDWIDGLDDIFTDAQPSGVCRHRVHERCGKNPHAHLLRSAWQVVGSLQRLSHESILSTPTLLD